MTTAAGVKNLVQLLLARHPKLVLARRLIVLPPIRHVISAILIDRTSMPVGFTPCWATNCLFDPQHEFYLSYGSRIFPPPGVDWEIDRPNIQLELAETVEQSGLPEIRAIKTIEHFRDFATHGLEGPGRRLNENQLQNLYVQIAMGQFDEAEKACNYLKQRRSIYSHACFDADIRRIKELVGPLLLARDRGGLAALLHEWEEITVNKLGLKKHWQPSPFPLETVKPE